MLLLVNQQVAYFERIARSKFVRPGAVVHFHMEGLILLFSQLTGFENAGACIGCHTESCMATDSNQPLLSDLF